MDDKAMVRTVSAEMQPFKKAENYFTDSLLFQENSKVMKKLLHMTSTTAMNQTQN